MHRLLGSIRVSGEKKSHSQGIAHLNTHQCQHNHMLPTVSTSHQPAKRQICALMVVHVNRLVSFPDLSYSQNAHLNWSWIIHTPPPKPPHFLMHILLLYLRKACQKASEALSGGENFQIFLGKHASRPTYMANGFHPWSLSSLTFAGHSPPLLKLYSINGEGLKSTKLD